MVISPSVSSQEVASCGAFYGAGTEAPTTVNSSVRMKGMIAMRTRGTFQPGQGGRTLGARNKLQSAFLRDLAEAWERGGKAALKIMLAEEPSRFVQVCASLMPKEVALDVGGPLAELSDAELRELMEAVKQLRARTIEETATREEFEEADTSGAADAGLLPGLPGRNEVAR
jgi:hypothetical protein